MNIWQKSLTATAVAAAVMIPAPALAYVQPINLNINQSYYLTTSTNITKIAVANPKIADVKILGNNAINIVAFATGTTTFNIWTQNGMRQEYQVTVSKEDKGLAKLIEKAIDLPGVKVQLVGDRVLLRGVVKNQYEKTLAFRIASLYIGDDSATATKNVTKKMGDGVVQMSSDIEAEEDLDTSARVVNLLEMANPDQINVESMVIEINSDDAKKLGVEYSSPSGVDVDTTSGFKTVTDGTVGEFYAGSTYGTQRNSGSHWYTRNWLYTHFSQINARIRALVSEGKARIISRPNITTMSGKSAGILVGGEIPIPVKNDDTVTVEYKPYGIQLNLKKPLVDSDGNITAELEAKVSRLDWSNAVTVNGFNMPGLSTRSAITSVNIPTGMTMAIGGLLNSEESSTVSKIPVLGNIPIIGELFKYHNKTKQKSEIMILITPRVVNESSPVKMSEKMQDAYQKAREEDEKMIKVDTNAELPPVQAVVPNESAPKQNPPPAAKTTTTANNGSYSLDNIMPVK